VDTKSRLADLPGMDEIKIGPAGETMGQLKQAVVDARAALLRDSTGDTVGALNDALRMLRAAYVRIGLPYVTP